MGRLRRFLDSLGGQRPPRLTPDGRVLRFDVHQRVQHVLMFTSLIALVLTGWPLKAAGVGPSAHIARALGGVERLALLHRTAAVVMLIACAYHLVYLGLLASRGRLSFDIVPTPKDVRDLAHHIRFYLGLAKERPRFGRYTYWEKFDYWAVFWGIFIIGGSGLVLWFPVKAVAVAPPWIVNISHILHSDEALLALMYLFIFHFYMVHLRPAVFPMSWVWLDGRMSLEEYRHEHPADLERVPADELVAAEKRARAAAARRGGGRLAAPPKVVVKEIEPEELLAAARVIVAANERKRAPRESRSEDGGASKEGGKEEGDAACD